MNTLPSEMILHIISFLDAPSAFKFHQTCRSHRKVYRDNPTKIQKIFSFRLEFGDFGYYARLSTPKKTVSHKIIYRAVAVPLNKRPSNFAGIKGLRFNNVEDEVDFMYKFLLRSIPKDSKPIYWLKEFIIQGTLTDYTLCLAREFEKLSNCLVVDNVYPHFRTNEYWTEFLDIQSPEKLAIIDDRSDSSIFTSRIINGHLGDVTSVFFRRYRKEFREGRSEDSLSKFLERESILDFQFIDVPDLNWSNPAVKARIKNYFDGVINLRRLSLAIPGKVAEMVADLRRWDVQLVEIREQGQWKTGILKRWTACGRAGKTMTVTMRMLPGERYYSIIFEQKTFNGGILGEFEGLSIGRS